jgi:hypothetical protein
MALSLVPIIIALAIPAASQTPKYGGVLVSSPISAPPSLSPHEEATIATVVAAAPCFNALVGFDPVKKQESVDTIVPDLAGGGRGRTTTGI